MQSQMQFYLVLRHRKTPLDCCSMKQKASEILKSNEYLGFEIFQTIFLPALKKLLPCLFLLQTISVISFSQQSSRIELRASATFSSYPPFLYEANTEKKKGQFNNSVAGLDLGYLWNVGNNQFLRTGIGYSVITFDKQRGVAQIVMEDILLHTDYYSYFCIPVTLGFEKAKILNRGFQFTYGGNIVNYFTYRQKYSMPGLSYFHRLPLFNSRKDDFHQTSKTRHFAVAVLGNMGLKKQISRIRIGLETIIPIYEMSGKDEFFANESNGQHRSNFFRGIGGALTVDCQIR